MKARLGHHADLENSTRPTHPDAQGSLNGAGLSGQHVNQHSTVTHFPHPTVTYLQEGGTGGEAPPPGQPARTIHPNPFYADHPWLPFLRCPMRRSCYSQRAGSNSDANSLPPFNSRCPERASPRTSAVSASAGTTSSRSLRHAKTSSLIRPANYGNQRVFPTMIEQSRNRRSERIGSRS